MAKTISYLRPPDKRIRNSQTTNIHRATAYYFNHILIIGAIRNIVGRGAGMGIRGSSNRINSTCTIDFEMFVRLLSFFFYFDDKSRDKQEIN